MDKAVLIVGGGKVAVRRARVLIDFGALVTVVSPEICAEMRELIGHIVWKQQRFDRIGQDFSLVLAATDDRNTNKRIGESAKALGIPVSVADRKEESTFWFPAIAKGEGIVAGLISESGDHSTVKEAAGKVRKVLSSSVGESSDAKDVLSSAGGHSSNAQEACPVKGDMVRKTLSSAGEYSSNAKEVLSHAGRDSSNAQDLCADTRNMEGDQ